MKLYSLLNTFIIITILTFISFCGKKQVPVSLDSSALLVVDMQVGRNPGAVFSSDEKIPEPGEIPLPEEWKKAGLTAEDVIDAIKHERNVAFPNSLKVIEYFKKINRPVIYLRWGSFVDDALDMEPNVRKESILLMGEDTSKWDVEIIQVDPRLLKVAKGIEVVKTGHDAFTSSNINYVLKNLNIKNVFMIGGHTNACYLATAQSAKKNGYNIISIHDATTDAFETKRMSGIEKAEFDLILSSEELISEKNDYLKK